MFFPPYITEVIYSWLPVFLQFSLNLSLTLRFPFQFYIFFVIDFSHYDKKGSPLLMKNSRNIVLFYPSGEMYLPFAEMPHLRNIALTGDEEDDSRYQALVQGEGSIPRNRQITSGNEQPFPGGGATSSGFKPVYD